MGALMELETLPKDSELYQALERLEIIVQKTAEHILGSFASSTMDVCLFLEAYDLVFQIAVSDDPSGQVLYLNLPILTKKVVSRNIEGSIPKINEVTIREYFLFLQKIHLLTEGLQFCLPRYYGYLERYLINRLSADSLKNIVLQVLRECIQEQNICHLDALIPHVQTISEMDIIFQFGKNPSFFANDENQIKFQRKCIGRSILLANSFEYICPSLCKLTASFLY